MSICRGALSSVLLVLLGANLYAQDFSEIKNQRVGLDNFNEENIDNLISNLYTFVGEDFDSLDVEILSQGPILGAFIVGMTSQKDSITYGDIYEKWLEIKEQVPHYTDLRVKQKILHTLEKLPADIRNWESDKSLFIELGMEEELLEKLRLYMKENSQPSETYETVLIGFREQLAKEKEEEKAANRSEFSKILAVSSTIDEIELLYQSQDENKPILLYFTGHLCVNCRKIEYNVFSAPAVNESIMENFIFQPLYVDDRTELPLEGQREVMLGERIMELKSVGDENSFYQMSRFDVATQPYFVILNSYNEVLEITDYETSSSVEEFLSFLNEGLTKMK